MLPKGMNGFKYSQETDLKVSQVRVSLLQWVLLQNPDLAWSSYSRQTFVPQHPSRLSENKKGGICYLLHSRPMWPG